MMKRLGSGKQISWLGRDTAHTCSCQVCNSLCKVGIHVSIVVGVVGDAADDSNPLALHIAHLTHPTAYAQEMIVKVCREDQNSPNNAGICNLYLSLSRNADRAAVKCAWMRWSPDNSMVKAVQTEQVML